eukprot:g59.t1
MMPTLVRNDANIGLRNQRNDETISAYQGSQQSPTITRLDPCFRIRFETTTSAQARTNRKQRNIGNLAKGACGPCPERPAVLCCYPTFDPPVAPMSPIVPDKQPADGFANTTLQLLLPSYGAEVKSYLEVT